MGKGGKPCDWRRNHHFASSSVPPAAEKPSPSQICQRVAQLVGHCLEGKAEAMLRDALAASKVGCILHSFVFSPWHPPSLLRKPSWRMVSAELNNMLTPTHKSPQNSACQHLTRGLPPASGPGAREEGKQSWGGVDVSSRRANPLESFPRDFGPLEVASK